MSKFHNTAKAALKDFGNQQNHRNKRRKEAIEETTEMVEKPVKMKLLPDLTIYECSFCAKAFQSRKFVWKHFVRRHSDELLRKHMLVKSTADDSSSDNCHRNSESYPVASVAKSLKKTGIQTLFKEIQHVQHLILSVQENTNNETRLQNNNLSQLQVEMANLHSKIQSLEHSLNQLNRHFNELQRNVKKELSDLEVVIVQYQTNANKHLNEALQVQNGEILSLKRDLETGFNAVEKVMDNNQIKQKKDMEIKLSVLDNKHSQNAQSLKLKLESSLASFKEQGNLQHIETMFENHLQSYLSKINKRSRSPNTSNTKQFNQRLDLPNYKQKNPRSNVPNFEQERMKSRTEQINPRLENSEELSVRETSSVQVNKEINIDDILEESKKRVFKSLDQGQLYSEVLDAVAAKMQYFQFIPGITRFPIEEYKKKLKLLNRETQYLKKKIRNFKEIYHQMNTSVEIAANDLNLRNSQDLAQGDKFFPEPRESFEFLPDAFNQKYSIPKIADKTFVKDIDQMSGDDGSITFIQPFKMLPTESYSSESSSSHEDQNMLFTKAPKHVTFNSTVNEAGDGVNIKELDILHDGFEAHNRESLSSEGSFFRNTFEILNKNEPTKFVELKDGMATGQEKIPDDLASKESLSSWDGQDDDDCQV